MSLLEEKYTVVIKRMTFPIAFMYDPETGDGLDIAMEKARTILNRIPLVLELWKNTNMNLNWRASNELRNYREYQCL